LSSAKAGTFRLGPLSDFASFNPGYGLRNQIVQHLDIEQLIRIAAPLGG